MLRRRSFAALWLLALSACRSEPPPKLHVLAAASLADVLPGIADTWSGTPGGMPVELVLDGTSRLAAQIEAGAPADVFFAADRAWVDALAGKDLVLADTRHEILGNRLVVVTPVDSPQGPRSIDELADVRRLALAGASVPAGEYARASLTSLGLLDAVAAKIVEGDNVRTALSWVGKGEADAAIVYATDAKVEPRVQVVFELPAASHPAIVYSIVGVAQTKHGDAVRGFIDHVRSDAARAVFREAGFAAPP
jgi:molybdate transport system substrate-binding protein